MVASRRSGDMRTSGIVMTCAPSTSSWTRPRASISAKAWRISSPTRSWRCVGPVILWARRWAMKAPEGGALPDTPAQQRYRTRRVLRSQRAGNGLDVETLHHIADADILVAGECHAALLSGGHLAHLVLEALQGGQRALVNDDVVANEPHLGAALDLAIRDAAARNPADLGNIEHLQNLGVAKEHLAHGRRQQPGHGLLHVVDQVVDDVVVADLDAGLVGGKFRLRVGTHVEAHHHGMRGAGQRH